MKFTKDMRYNGKAGRVLNNQQLKDPIQIKESDFSKIVFFSTFSIVNKKDIPYFLSRSELRIDSFIAVTRAILKKVKRFTTQILL